MITRLIIQHFKSAHHVDVELHPVTILAGPNGVGKSNVLDALRFLKDATTYSLDRAVSDRHGIDSIREWSRSSPYSITIEVHFNEDAHASGRYSLGLGSSSGFYRILREEGEVYYNERDYISSQDGQETEIVLTKKRMSFSRDKDGTVSAQQFDFETLETISTEKLEAPIKDDLIINSYNQIFDYEYYSGMRIITAVLRDFEAYAIFPNTLRTPQSTSNDTRLASDGRNLTSIFKALQKSKRTNESKQEILLALKTIMPNLESISIHSLGGLMVPTFRVREKDAKATQHDFNVSQISDGTLRMLGLLTALYQPRAPSVIALEEPEQTIHPGALGILADALKEMADRSQIIITTHSPHLLDHFDPDSILAVDLEEGRTRVGRIALHQRNAIKERLLTTSELVTTEGLAVQE
ncbi:MAG: AAA family ATPase [Alphaproteobacteria bacterium]|nr:AAA family ATPase [Alphaproteobacteria bacterium]